MDRHKLEAKYRHATVMERKAATRVKRAASLLQKWQRARRRYQNALGDAEVRKITARLLAGVAPEKPIEFLRDK